MRWWFGRRRPRRNLLPTPACYQGGAAECQGELGGYWGEGECLAWVGRRARARDGTRRGRQCGGSAQCARVQNVRSGRAQSTHGTCSTKCQRALELEGGAGTAQDGGRGNKALSGQGGSVRGPSPQCKPEGMPKIDPAHRTFDRMPWLARQLLGWPNSPDPSLFRSSRRW